jgi:hypothetical protein
VWAEDKARTESFYGKGAIETALRGRIDAAVEAYWSENGIDRLVP